jgi:hypothetical protein
MFALLVALASLGAAPQAPAGELPVSVERIREELKRTPALDVNRPVEQPVATFRMRIEQRVYVLSLEDWIEKEFRLTALQRQSAAWAGTCCGGYVLASGAYGVRLDPLIDRLEKALQRRRVRKIRERIARELAELEAARKKRALQEKSERSAK